MVLILLTLDFFLLNKFLVKLKRKIASTLMCLIMKMVWFIQSMYRMENLSIAWIYCRYQIIINRIIYIKYFTKFTSNKKKDRHKKHFSRRCLQCFNREKNLVDHKEVCLKINVKWQRVKSRNGSTEFNNFSTQLVVPFQIYF